MKAQDLKFNKFIAEKGIKVNELPSEIQAVITTINKSIGLRLIAIKDEAKKQIVIDEYIKTSDTITDFLQLWLDNPEIRDMDIAEIFADEDIEGEVKKEVKEQVQEIKEQVEDSNKVITEAEKEANTVVKEQTEPVKTQTNATNKKEAILKSFYDSGKTKVTLSDLKGAGYPCGFFDESIYRNTGAYRLVELSSWEDTYRIDLR